MSTARTFEATRASTSGIVNEAILYVQRASLRPVLRQELKAAGVGEVFAVEDSESCIQHLVKYPHALLVVDVEAGGRAVNGVLAAAQGSFKADTRPIFLIAPELSHAIVGLGSEYNVGRIHSGEISRAAVHGHIQTIVRDEADGKGARAALQHVADARLRGDLDRAGELLEDLQRRFPSDLRLQCELADNMIQEGRWDEAMAVLDHARGVDPHNLRAQHLFARCLMKKGRFDEAAALLHECKAINPYHIERLLDLGTALMSTGRIQEALQSFAEVLDLDAGNRRALEGKAQCQLLVGDVNEALALLKQLSGGRELAALFNNAAVLAIRQGRFEQGTSLYKTAIGALGTRDGLAARLFFNLGVAYHKMSRDDEALDCFGAAASLDPQFAKAKHNADALAAKLGRPAGADVFGGDFADERVENKV